MPARLKIGLQALSVAVVAALLGLLIWKVVHQDKGPKLGGGRTPPGPGNPLGTRWMGLSSPGVGIHGTPESGSIGYSESHGCIRMLIPQAEWLFDHVTVGTPVFIVSQ